MRHRPQYLRHNLIIYFIKRHYIILLNTEQFPSISLYCFITVHEIAGRSVCMERGGDSDGRLMLIWSFPHPARLLQGPE